MKIELRKINYNKKLSQETSAFTAEIWVDGIKKGSVKNSGTGGPDLILPFTLSTEINNYAKTLPKVNVFGKLFDMSAEMIFADLLEKHLVSKHLARMFKTKTVFLKSDGKIWAIKGTAHPPDAIKILNKLSLDEAATIYIASSK